MNIYSYADNVVDVVFKCTLPVLMEGQDQGELFEIMPEPGRLGLIENPDAELFGASAEWRRVTRKEAHAKGIWHRAVGIWLYNDAGEVLLQKRSMFKDSNPGKWTSSAAGHGSAGQTVTGTMVTEIEEELGITVREDDMEFVAVFAEEERGSTEKYGTFIDREYRFVFLSNIKDVDFHINPKEVSEVKFVPFCEAMEKFLSEDPEFCPMERTHALLSKKALERVICK